MKKLNIKIELIKINNLYVNTLAKYRRSNMKFKQRINSIIRDKKSDVKLLNKITHIKSKLVAQKSFDVNYYNQISDLEQTLYRYNNFIKYNLNREADKEARKLSNIAENIDNQSTILYGGISNIQYIWHTEPNACETCQALDGKVYENEDDIPEKPHPNCKCSIEIIDKDNKQDKPDNKEVEPCDCWKFFDNIGEVLNEAESLQHEVINEKNDIGRIISNYVGSSSDLIQGLINDIVSLEDPLNTLFQTISIFLVNYNEMKDADTHGADKYFHARANCEAAQRGIVGSMIAKAIGDLREFTDNYRNIHEKKYTLEESLKDIQEDLEANQEGRDLGRKYPTANPYDILRHRVPNGLPERYRKY